MAYQVSLVLAHRVLEINGLQVLFMTHFTSQVYRLVVSTSIAVVSVEIPSKIHIVACAVHSTGNMSCF